MPDDGDSYWLLSRVLARARAHMTVVLNPPRHGYALIVEHAVIPCRDLATLADELVRAYFDGASECRAQARPRPAGCRELCPGKRAAPSSSRSHVSWAEPQRAKR